MTPAALHRHLAALDADARRVLEPLAARAKGLRIAAEAMFDAAPRDAPAARKAAEAAYVAAVEAHGHYARALFHIEARRRESGIACH